ncbi:MAG: helix-turn-helix domain-containing protein [Shewanella sp.]|nr:helix-turn-helix domain-containing protein [Shewanella sp.]
MDKLMTPLEVAEILGVTKDTLSIWRCTGRYQLNYIKVGRLVMYQPGDVESFLNQRKHQHTSMPCSS